MLETTPAVAFSRRRRKNKHAFLKPFAPFLEEPKPFMYFSEAFRISSEILADENVFDISLVSDLPLFIDPFLIFDSRKPDYQKLHGDIIRYVSFLRDKVVAGRFTESQKRDWFHFPEIPNNWLGYSVGSNSGRGLRDEFARDAADGLRGPLHDFGTESISRGSHIERLFLFSKGAGKDALSDFITNLCHEFLLRFTQNFALKHLSADHRRQFDVRHVRFDYQIERWTSDKFTLPFFGTEYVLLTPTDLLTQSVPWINRPDLFDRFGGMLEAVRDAQLRDSVNTFLNQRLSPPANHPKNKEYRPPKKDVRSAYAKALKMFPDLANWYVSIKESLGADAVTTSKKRVLRAQDLYRGRVLEFLASTLKPSGFFEIDVKDTAKLLSIFAEAIETNGSTLFFGADGLVEELSTKDVELICTLAWRADGNRKRRLPEFRFVHDAASTSKLESAFLKERSERKSTDMLVVTTDCGKKSRVELLIAVDSSSVKKVVSITGGTGKASNMKRVFISYTKADENWARWIGSVLMSAGYTVTVQYKSFLPGTNFVEQMDEAIKNSVRTIAVLSPNYLKSDFAAAEWQAAFRDDPLGQKRKLVPVRISKVTVSGLLGSVVYADLFDLTEESATAVLLGAIGAENRPTRLHGNIVFPGKKTGTDEFQDFLEHMPSQFGRGSVVTDAPRRLKLATAIGTLSTNQVNLLVYALNPPENEIPPVSAPAKDRAAALLAWTSRANIELSDIEELIQSLQT